MYFVECRIVRCWQRSLNSETQSAITNKQSTEYQEDHVCGAITITKRYLFYFQEPNHTPQALVVEQSLLLTNVTCSETITKSQYWCTDARRISLVRKNEDSGHRNKGKNLKISPQRLPLLPISLPASTAQTRAARPVSCSTGIGRYRDRREIRPCALPPRHCKWPPASR